MYYFIGVIYFQCHSTNDVIPVLNVCLYVLYVMSRIVFYLVNL